MSDKKAQDFILKQQTALNAVVNGLEELKTLRTEYDALDYGSITDEDLDGSMLEDYDPSVFPDTWAAVDAFYAVLLTYKTILYKALP